MPATDGYNTPVKKDSGMSNDKIHNESDSVLHVYWGPSRSQDGLVHRNE